MRKLVTFAAIVTSAALLWAAPVRAQSNPPQDDVTAATDSQPSRARKAETSATLSWPTSTIT